MPTDIKPFIALELLNVKIDVWIDEEDYDEVYNCITLDIKSQVKTDIEEAFRDSSKFKSIFINEKGKDNNPQNAIQSTDINNAEKKEKWKPLFFSKYLRARIQENGTDDYTKHLDDLVIYLQRNLPYQFPQEDQDEELILQHLYFQELSACGKPGLESLGFAVRAYELVKVKRGTMNESHFSFDLYNLWAQYNQGIGYLHSGQKMDAASFFNEIIRDFPKKAKCLQPDEKGFWQNLLFDQAVLFKAELMEDLQFSYHTIQTLEEIGNRKKENRLIKEALAFRDMGRLECAKKKIIKLLNIKPEAEIEDIFGALKSKTWEKKKNRFSKTLGLLFDYYLQDFKEKGMDKINEGDIIFIVKKFIEYKDKTINSKTERMSYYQQVARFLKWLSDQYKETKDDHKDNTYLKQIEALYDALKGFLLPDKVDEKEDGVKLGDFDKYEYDRYTESMEKFYKNLTHCKFYGYIEDEQCLLGKLNEYEKKRSFLFKFKELERKQRIERIERLKEGLPENVCEKSTKCFHENPDSSSAFKSVLECVNRSRSPEENKSQEHENSTDPRGSEYSDNDYETIMQRENNRFLDYLAYKSRHPIYYLQEDTVKKSYHFMGLQRWNSQTPTLTLSKGGGYLLYEQDKHGKVTLGIAIDPGFDFVDNLFHMGFTLNDIDFILLSHAHLDHIRDFEPIVTSLLDLKKRKKDSNKKIHAMMTWGVYRQLKHVITNHTLREFLADTYIVDIDKDVDPEKPPESFSFMKRLVSSKNKENKFIFESITPDDNSQKKCIGITPKQAYHNDYSERSDSYGYIINFYDGNNEQVFSFGYTGDTKWYDGELEQDGMSGIHEQYEQCNAVCIHLGALIESDKGKKFKNYNGDECDALIEKKQHPYLFGLLRYLKKIQEDNNKNKLLLISEFGEELKGGIRIDFIRRLNNLFKIGRKANQENQSPVCLPVDIGLNVILACLEDEKQEPKHQNGKWETGPPYKVWCHGCEKFVDADKIRYRHFGHGNNDEALFYFCNVCLKSKAENAIQDRMRLICEVGVPLEKAHE